MNNDRPLLEDFLIDAINVPVIGHTYRHDGRIYECYDVHTKSDVWSNSGDEIITVSATYRRIQDNGDDD